MAASAPLNAADAAPAKGFVAIPASGGTALEKATRAIAVTTSGNLGVMLEDGTDNNSALIAVVAGQVLPLAVVKFTAANTAGAIGLR